MKSEQYGWNGKKIVALNHPLLVLFTKNNYVSFTKDIFYSSIIELIPRNCGMLVNFIYFSLEN